MEKNHAVPRIASRLDSIVLEMAEATQNVAQRGMQIDDLESQSDELVRKSYIMHYRMLPWWRRVLLDLRHCRCWCWVPHWWWPRACASWVAPYYYPP